MYSIYHIPTFVHKDGSIGKIGCTHQEVEVRVGKQGYSDYEVLEVHEDIDVASKREIELQKEYGYKVDNVPYYHSLEMFKKATEVTKKLMQSDYGDKLRKKAQLSNKKHNSKVILQLDLNGNLIREWVGIKETARYFKLAYTNLSKCLNGKQKTFAGYKWKYKD